MRSQKDLVLCFLRDIANSESEEEYHKRVGQLKSNTIWNTNQSSKLQIGLIKLGLVVIR